MHNNNSGTWRTTWAFVAFFLVMALLVPFAMRRGWGMSGIFFAMVLASATAYLIPHTIKLFRQRLEEQGISLKDWGKFMAGAGYEASIVDVSLVTFPEEAAPSSTELIVYEEYIEDEYEGEEDEHQEAIIEPHGMHLADDFRPSVDSFLSMCFVMIGIRRSGKSNGIADVCEELARWSVPIVIADTEDEYSALADRRYMPRGILAGSLDMLKANPELRSKHFIPIDLNGAYNFGYALLDSGLQVVLNLKSFADDDEAAMIMTEIITGMNAWEEQRPQSQRVPCMFVLDEANKWLPQQTNESCLSKDVLIELQRAIFGVMVRRGGKRGLGLGLATQRIAELDKRACRANGSFYSGKKNRSTWNATKRWGLTRTK